MIADNIKHDKENATRADRAVETLVSSCLLHKYYRVLKVGSNGGVLSVIFIF